MNSLLESEFPRRETQNLRYDLMAYTDANCLTSKECHPCVN